RMPAGSAATRPASSTSAIAAGSKKCPFTAPAHVTGNGDAGGKKLAVGASYASAPRACENKCTAGLYPPDTAITSQSNDVDTPPARDTTSARDTRRRPRARI